MMKLKQSEPPKVTGLSPKEGPPGTRITMRGENLGISYQDIIALRICGVECLMSAEWISPSKVIARTGLCKSTGDVIIVTKSGGVGTCTVKFRGFTVHSGPLQESAVWVDESRLFDTTKSRRAQSPLASEEDPLGLSDETAQRRIPEEELLELYPEGSGNLHSEYFSPKWFLLENHQASAFDDLKAGLTHLRRKRKEKFEGPGSFVKDNLDSFTDCLNTLQSLQGMIMSDQRASDGELTDTEEDLLKESLGKASNLFEDVLKRRDRAETTRNAVIVLQRFRFLFSLPASIERNIKKGDIEIVINDYVRAKSLFANSQISLFKNVHDDVEARVQDLQRKLESELLQLPSTIEKQKKLIGYLNGLDMSGDPAWKCISNYINWIIGSMLTCKEQHLTVEQAGRSDADGRTCYASTFDIKNLSTMSAGQGVDQGYGRFRTPQRVLFVEELTEILAQHLPDVYKLGLSYFSGALQKNVPAEQSQEFTMLLKDLLQQYCVMLRAALLQSVSPHLSKSELIKFAGWQDSKSDVYTDWIPHCIRYIRAFYSLLQELSLSDQLLSIIQCLLFDMRVECMTALFHKASVEIQNLTAVETWNLGIDDEAGSTTELPLKFERIVCECLQILKDIVKPGVSGEEEIVKKKSLNKDVVKLCSTLINSFVPALQILASTDEPKQHRTSQLGDSSVQHVELGMNVRLLVVLSNCQFVLNRILPRIMELLEKHGYPDLDKIKKGVTSKYENLARTLVNKYVEIRSDPIVGAIEQNMYVGQFTWNDSYKPTEVHGYMKEIIFRLIAVHAEVYASCPVNVNCILTAMLEVVVLELSRLLCCVTKFSESGALQAVLDLSALQQATPKYQSPQVRNGLKEAVDHVMKCCPSVDENTLTELVDTFTNHMKLHLVCFTSECVRCQN